MSFVEQETLALWLALVGYSVATAMALVGVVFRKRPERVMLALLGTSVALHTVSIGIRWLRIGHLPVGNSYEMLSANVWGLMVAVLAGYWMLPRMRAFAAMVLPVVILLTAWMLLIPSQESSLPPTYDTIWLYIHIAFIKLFVGCAFIALGMALIVLLRAAGANGPRLGALPDDRRLDEQAYRFMALGLIFDTMGVAAGAIWAQDAWGSYWSWDPLEVWSLVTWLCIGLTLHLRATFRTGPTANAAMVVLTFVIAFFTFFGIPFVTTALHKGAI
jgi:cytochrome c-type biogenesis protein CcsB